MQNFVAQFAPVDAPKRPAAIDPMREADSGARQSFDDLHQPAPPTTAPIQPDIADAPAGASIDRPFSEDLGPADPAGVDAPQAAPTAQDVLAGRLKRLTDQRTRRLWRYGAGIAMPSLLGLLVLIFGLWSWQTGRIDIASYRLAHSLEALGGGVGLTLEDVRVNGRAHTQLEDIAEAIGVNDGAAILAVDPPSVKARLESLPWVEQARVERLLPHGLTITLQERQAIAIWQNNGIHRLIDKRGVEIFGARVEPFADSLPIVTGQDAPEHTAALVETLTAEPELYAQTLAATRVGKRRWDLTLIGEVVVRLPSDGVSRAWSALAAAQRQAGLLDRDVQIVDLRADDRIVVTSQSAPVANRVNYDAAGPDGAPTALTDT